MTLENVANEDLTISFTSTGGPPDLVYGGDQSLGSAVTATASTTCDAPSGKDIQTKSVVILWTPEGGCAFTSATHTFVSGGGTVLASATKTKADGEFVLRENDSGTCVGSWNPPSGPAVACGCDVTLNSAGQIKAKAQ